MPVTVDRRAGRGCWILSLLCAGAMLAATHGAWAQVREKPYDDKLFRLAEVLGAVHYLRELCGANEGQAWRDRMRELLEAEGASPLRRARLTKSFNQGYQSYNSTYKVCTPTAKTAIERFMAEGVQLAEAMVRSVP